MDMEVQGQSSEIRRLLNMRGQSRLMVKSDLTFNIINSLKSLEVKPIRLKFMESQLKRSTEKNQDWVEIKVMLEILKLEENNPAYFCQILKDLYKTFSFLKDNNDIQEIGLQEMECGMPKYYYLLIYIHQNYGK